VNWEVVPADRLMVVVVAVITILCKVADATVTVVEPDTVPTVAWTVAEPTNMPVTTPFVAVASLTVAAPAGLLVDTLQVAELVRAFVVLSS